MEFPCNKVIYFISVSAVLVSLIELQQGRTPLMEACISGHKEIVDLLVAAGADVRARTNVRKSVLLELL